MCQSINRYLMVHGSLLTAHGGPSLGPALPQPPPISPPIRQTPFAGGGFGGGVLRQSRITWGMVAATILVFSRPLRVRLLHCTSFLFSFSFSSSHNSFCTVFATPGPVTKTHIDRFRDHRKSPMDWHLKKVRKIDESWLALWLTGFEGFPIIQNCLFF